MRCSWQGSWHTEPGTVGGAGRGGVSYQGERRKASGHFIFLKGGMLKEKALLRGGRCPNRGVDNCVTVQESTSLGNGKGGL